jgi:hypothetical protein
MTPETVNVTIEQPGVHQVFFGNTLEQYYPKPIKIEGILQAPIQFLVNKDFDAKTSTLTIDRDKNCITLSLDERSEPSACTVIGKLQDSLELQEWGINSSKRYTVSSFIQLLRERKFYFKHPPEQEKIIMSLQKFSVNVSTVIKQHNDERGNSLAMLERKVNDIDLIKEFVLSIPIYKGCPNKEFTVLVGLDPKSSQVDFYLYSDELFSLIKTEREGLFNEAVNEFKKLGFNCSVVYLS